MIASLSHLLILCAGSSAAVFSCSSAEECDFLEQSSNVLLQTHVQVGSRSSEAMSQSEGGQTRYGEWHRYGVGAVAVAGGGGGGGNGSKMLILILSCHRYNHTWASLREWAASVHPQGSVLILAGLPPGTSALRNKQPYDLSLADGTLFVASGDTYNSLPEKVVRAFISIRNDPQLQHITHVLKVDDTSIAEFPATYDAGVFESALADVAGDYFSSMMNYAVVNCAEPSPHCESTYHLQHEDESSYWHNRTYHFPQATFLYALGGGGGYIVSRRALDLVASRWPLRKESMDELAYAGVYEDVLLGHTLSTSGVTMRSLYVDGAKNHTGDMLSWWGHATCESWARPPDQAPDCGGVSYVACCFDYFRERVDVSSMCPQLVRD